MFRVPGMPDDFSMAPPLEIPNSRASTEKAARAMSPPSNLFRLIQSRSPADSSQPLIESEAHAHTWDDMFRATARQASFLSGLGLVKGDRVAVQVEKSPQALFLYLACLRAGLVYLPMNTAYREEEVDYLLGNAEPTVMVAAPEIGDAARRSAARHGVRHVLTLDSDGNGSLPEGAAGSPTDFDAPTCGGDDLAAILYTSGTTGRPKGAMLSHRNLAANALALCDSWAFSTDDVLLHALPLFHTHGLFVACHTVLLSGARMIWLPAFDRARVIRDLSRATVFMGVPTYYTRLLAGDDFGSGHCRNMRLFVSGSAPLLTETFAGFHHRTGHVILERYGMTETGMNTSNPYRGERRGGTVGFPLPGVSVRIVGEDGAPLPASQVGVLQVKGDNVFRGYWRMPEKTAEDFTADGWFVTGDLGRVDGDGYVHLVGRVKDLIITGGYNVYPKEVETVIDDVAGVVESAVIGIPHPDYGEAVVAVARRAAETAVSAETIIAQARERLANYKVPKHVEFLDELPRNAMGKVQKALLRQNLAHLFQRT